MKTIFFWDFCFAKIGKKPPLGPFYAANLLYTLRFSIVVFSIVFEFARVICEVELSKMTINIVGGGVAFLISELTEMAFKKYEPEMERAYKKLPENERKFNRILSIGSLIVAISLMSYLLGLLHN